MVQKNNRKPLQNRMTFHRTAHQGGHNYIKMSDISMYNNGNY